MAQFDLFRQTTSKQYPLLLDIQADLLRDLATHVVVPLTPLRRLRGQPLSRLNPVVSVDGVDHVVLFQELAAVPTKILAARVANLRARRDELIAALDLLFNGV